MKRAWVASVALVAVWTFCREARAIESRRLTDVVKSSGVGNIDLLKDLTPAELEAYRAEGAGTLLVAFDVNEAADGSEKAASQAVTLDSVVLRVVSGGATYTFSAYETQTQALLARAGTTTRLPYYTLLGDTGSARITASTVASSYDSVMRLSVPSSLASVTSAVLEVRFLPVNATLGDPERFYDFSNGYEDVALLSAADASYLDALAPGRNDAPAVVVTHPETTTPTTTQTVQTWTSYPSATDFYTVGFEDQYPGLGDYDFNDVLVSYRADVGRASDGSVLSLQGSAYLLARGARLDHDWRLRIPLGGTAAHGTMQITRTTPGTLATSTTSLSFTGDLDIAAFSSTKSFGIVNTDPARPFLKGPRIDFMVQLTNAVPAAKFGNAPFDPYIVIRDSGLEVHLPDYLPTPGSANYAKGLTSFKDAKGWPFAMLLPISWSFPWERVDLGLAYPELQTYVTSNAKLSQSWYDRPDAAKVRKYSKTEWEWR